jgi:mannobiose 2-epimerase
MSRFSLCFLLLCASAGAVSGQNGFPSEQHLPALDSIATWTEVRSAEVYRFWRNRAAVNHAQDGFFGDINGSGTVTKGQRNSIQQGRQLFVMAAWNRLGTPDRDAALVAFNQYTYFVKAFWDSTGGEFFIEDSHRPATKSRRLYNSAFAIYGLAHYHMAFAHDSDPTYRAAAGRALTIALRAFRALDERAHDTTYLGYQQRPVGTLALNETTLDGGDKEINTHLHLMEAFTSLYEAWKSGAAHPDVLLTDHDRRYIETHLKPRLEEMLYEVLAKKFCTERGEFAYCRTEFSRSWALVNTTYFSYAHDIETAWLFLEALRVLGPGHADEALVKRLAAKMIYTVDRFGMETVGNGLASVARGRISDLGVSGNWKDWWQHFEAFAGLYHGARLSADPAAQTRYLQRLKKVSRYLDESGIAVTFTGGQREYRWNTSGNNQLAGPWKAGYHTLRALLFVHAWAKEDKARIVQNEEALLPELLELLSNYPNPFNPNTMLRFRLAQASTVTLKVFDAAGRHIDTLLFSARLGAGIHAVAWDASGRASGVYVVRLEAGEAKLSRKITLVK